MGFKIAIPTKNGRVDRHYGTCALFTVYTVEENGISAEDTISAAALRGCKTGIADELKRAGVKKVLADEIGDGAARALAAYGIAVVRGTTGPVREAAEYYLADTIPC